MAFFLCTGATGFAGAHFLTMHSKMSAGVIPSNEGVSSAWIGPSFQVRMICDWATSNSLASCAKMSPNCADGAMVNLSTLLGDCTMRTRSLSWPVGTSSSSRQNRSDESSERHHRGSSSSFANDSSFLSIC
uniref:Uncharacterized protein n=1 Tax=Ixodes ricinus TaxID=34613 RepID=A0A6B0URA3_IXORI